MEDNIVSLKKIENELLDAQVARMLINVSRDTIEKFGTNELVDFDVYARKIVAFVREHIS